MNRTILMLEHDEDDRYITQAVFDEHRYAIRLLFVNNRDEFFSTLDTSRKKNERLPALILLNYHAMPSNAVDIVRELKSSMYYSQIPVIVLSGSVNSEVVSECYAAGAASFIQKPGSSKDTEQKIQQFFQYWFKTVELPV